MSTVEDLKTYSDVKRFVNEQAFRNSLSYMSWHNRLAMTALLATWQALVVAKLYEKRQVESYLFSNIKSWLDQHEKEVPQTIEECDRMAEELCVHLYPS